MRNVEIDDKIRIKRYAENRDMQKYVHDFLVARMPENRKYRKTNHPEPPIKIPKIKIPQITSQNDFPTLTISYSASTFINLMDADSKNKICLDFNVAGERWRSDEYDADENLEFSGKFEIKLIDTLPHLIGKGCGSIVAILKSGHNSCIYASGNFDWRKSLCGHYFQPITLESEPDSGDGCIISMTFDISSPLCSPEEFETAISKESFQASHICKLSSPLIQTPFHAFRFASLFFHSNRTYEMNGDVKVLEIDPKKDNKFSESFSIHNILASRYGTGPDICALLCSLFCGFGLESFVCGRTVVTIHQDHATIWDPFKGDRKNTETLPPLTLYGYRCQLEPKTDSPSYQTGRRSEWKLIEFPLPLTSPTILSCILIDDQLVEMEVKKLIISARGNLQTNFNNEIGNSLRPKLFSLESEKLNQRCDTWDSHVNDAISHLIPPKSSIKIVPLCIHSTDPRVIYQGLNQKASNIIHSRELNTFSFSLALFPYAEDLFICWCFLGALMSKPLK